MKTLKPFPVRIDRPILIISESPQYVDWWGGYTYKYMYRLRIIYPGKTSSVYRDINEYPFDCGWRICCWNDAGLSSRGKLNCVKYWNREIGNYQIIHWEYL